MRRHCLILLKNRSIKLRARHKLRLKQTGSLRFRFRGMLAHAPCLLASALRPCGFGFLYSRGQGQSHRHFGAGQGSYRSSPRTGRILRRGKPDRKAVALGICCRDDALRDWALWTRRSKTASALLIVEGFGHAGKAEGGEAFVAVIVEREVAFWLVSGSGRGRGCRRDG